MSHVVVSPEANAPEAVRTGIELLQRPEKDEFDLKVERTTQRLRSMSRTRVHLVNLLSQFALFVTNLALTLEYWPHLPPHKRG
jgi:hypothetical protein